MNSKCSAKSRVANAEMSKPLAFAALVLLGACQVRPVDPIEAAAFDAQRGCVLAALDRLDRVPASSVRYKQARTLAQALERRMRASYEKLLEGLTLRDEWRDEEAISRFQEAIEIWPDVVGAQGLIRATRSRIAALGDDRPGAWQRAAGLATREVMVITSEPFDGKAPPPAALAETTKAKRNTVPPLEAKRRRKLRGDAATLIRTGHMDRAMRILAELLESSPDDARLKAELARVQHQRGLLAYGQGRLKQAIEAWEHVLRLTPDHAQMRGFLRSAKAELAARKR